MNLDPSGQLFGLRKRAEYLLVQNHGRRFSGRYFLLLVRSSGLATPRAGFTISKRVGNAVVRNRVRRKLREIVRELVPLFEEGEDYVFIARAKAATASFSAQRKDVQWLLTQASRSHGRPNS